MRFLMLLALTVRFALHRRTPGGGGHPDGGGHSDGDGPGRPRDGDGSGGDRPSQRYGDINAADGVTSAQESIGDAAEQGRSSDDGGTGQSGTDRPGDGEGQPDDRGGMTTPEPDGVPKRRDDKWLKRQGIDPHEVKEGLPGPMSHFDLYVDRSGNIFAVRKGADPRSGEYVGNVRDYRD
jgi:Bacterial toxin 33